MTELIDRISAALVGLKMPRALEALGPTLRRLEQGEITAVEAIDALLSEDCALRETRRIDIALRTAKLLPVKTVESFDFAFQPSLDRERIAALAQLDFIRRRETVHFLGPPGTGKSHLATALGVAAVKAGKSVYKTTLAEPADSLAKAERQGRLAEKIRFFARAAILVVDEIGCLPITQGGASLFFQIADARYEKGANPRQNPIPAAVQNRSVNPAHPVGADRIGPLVSPGPSRNARNRHIEQTRNFTATPAVGACRNHALAKIIRIGSGHACWPPRQWPTSIMPWKKRESHKNVTAST